MNTLTIDMNLGYDTTVRALMLSFEVAELEIIMQCMCRKLVTHRRLAPVFPAEDADAWIVELRQDCRGTVCGAVVDNDQFPVRI